MELRPLDDELIFLCTTMRFCTNCPRRLACPIRYTFYYLDGLAFEIFLQTEELKFQKKFGTEFAFEGTDHIRQKVFLEKKNNPHYSFT